jgi:branched-chain amino acid transport system substrate-binding protein
LTGITARQLCEKWESESGKQWTPPVGSTYALFEVAIDVLRRTKSVDSREAILDSILATNYDTVFGHVQWTNNPNAYMVPVKNVCRTVMVGGQWVKGKGKFKYELLPIDNTMGKMVPVQAKLQAIKY